MCASDQKLSPGRARSGSKPSRTSFNSEGKNVPLLPVFSPDARLTMSHFVAAHVFSVKFTLRATSEEFCWERTVLEKNSIPEISPTHNGRFYATLFPNRCAAEIDGDDHGRIDAPS